MIVKHSLQPRKSVFPSVAEAPSHFLTLSSSHSLPSTLVSPSAPPSQLAIQFREASGSITCTLVQQHSSHHTHPHPRLYV